MIHRNHVTDSIYKKIIENTKRDEPFRIKKSLHPSKILLDHGAQYKEDESVPISCRKNVQDLAWQRLLVPIEEKEQQSQQDEDHTAGRLIAHKETNCGIEDIVLQKDKSKPVPLFINIGDTLHKGKVPDVEEQDEKD